MIFNRRQTRQFQRSLPAISAEAPTVFMNSIASGNMACFDDNEIVGPAERGCHRTFKK
jgi:hypothetical protein